MLGGSVDGKSLNLQGSPRPSAGLAGLLSVDAVAAGHLPPKRTTTEFVWILEPPKKKSIRSRKVKYYWSHELPSHVFFFWRYIPKFDPKNRSMFFFCVNEFRYVEKQIHSMFLFLIGALYWCTVILWFVFLRESEVSGRVNGVFGIAGWSKQEQLVAAITLLTNHQKLKGIIYLYLIGGLDLFFSIYWEK